MKINFVIFLEVLITLIHGQQQSCSLLASCLEKVKQQADSCSPLVDSVDGIGTAECTQAMKQGMKSLINLQAQRATASAACMGSSSGANITCEGMFMPKATIRRRRRQTNAKTGAGLQKMRQCLQEINRQQNECKQHLNGCDLARACQECYAKSQIPQAIAQIHSTLKEACKNGPNPQPEMTKVTANLHVNGATTNVPEKMATTMMAKEATSTMKSNSDKNETAAAVMCNC